MNFNTKVAQSIARWFGYKGVVGTDLITLRVSLLLDTSEVQLC